jgi:hypothetical protein
MTLDGIKFILEDGSWILFRPSGTESVVRIYVEARDKFLVEKQFWGGQKICPPHPNLQRHLIQKHGNLQDGKGNEKNVKKEGFVRLFLEITLN